MKGTQLFSSLGAINEEYLNEALAYKKRSGGRAKILRFVLPAAAAIALLSVSLLFILPFAQAGGAQSDAVAPPVQPNGGIEAVNEVGDPSLLSAAVPTEADGSGFPAGETPTRTSIEDLRYEKYDDHVEITDYLGNDDVIVLPDSIDELPITKVELSEKTAEGLVGGIRFNDDVLADVVVPVSNPIKLTVGKDVLTIDGSLLHNPGVSEFEVEAGNPNYTSFCGMLYNKDCTTLIACPAGYKTPAIDYDPKNNMRADKSKSYLAAQLQVISDKAFADCAAIRSVVLPKNLKKIGVRAFAGCSSLRALSLPAGLRTVGTSVFERCSSLSYLRYDGSYEDFGLYGITLPATANVFYALTGDVSAEQTAKIVSFFEEAERYCALFTRFAMIGVGAETNENGAKIVTEPGVASKEDLTALLDGYFEDGLKDAIVAEGFDAYYEVTDGVLYAFKKTITVPFDEGKKDREYAVTKTDDGYILTLRITVPMLNTKAYVDCRYHLAEQDGKLIFTDSFTLPAQAWYGLYLIESAI